MLFLKIEAELVSINGKLINLTILPIVGNSACLLRKLFYLLYGTQERSMDIRKEIVRNVTNNWDEFAVMSHGRHGNNYGTIQEYTLDMLQCYNKIIDEIYVTLLTFFPT